MTARTKRRAHTSCRRAFDDKNLLGHVMVGETWKPHRILQMAAMGEKLTDDERIVFQRFTGRSHEPGQRVATLAIVGGRRTGKTVLMSSIASYLGTLVDYSDVLIRGEIGVLLVLAQDQRNATNILNYVEENLAASPVLRQLVIRRTQDAIELKNNIRIEVRPASFRKLRGPTYIAILADELSFWYTEEGYQNPDVEVLAAARPGLLTTRGPVIMASSPYARRGVLWDTFDKHYGANGAPLVLVAKGTTTAFNPTIPQSEIDAEIERDPIRNTAEYLAEFRSDLEAFVSLEAVQACVSTGIRERAPKHYTTYFGFVDPSGGSQDSFTLAIGHVDHSKQTVVLDAIRETKPPFSPEAVCYEYAQVLSTYRISKVIGDNYAKIWPVEQFGRFGILYEQSAAPKSDLYLGFLALLNSRRVELLDHPKLVSQLVGLERSTRGAGKIDHRPGAHDDIANAVAGVAAVNNKYGAYDPQFLGWQDEADRQEGVDKNTSAFKNRLLGFCNAMTNGGGGGGGRWG